jgi:hypothetical protein
MTPGTFLISYGDAPSLRMVRVVRDVRADGSFTAPYIRADWHLRRFDSLVMPTNAVEDFTPLSAWGRSVGLMPGGSARIVKTGEPEIATYPEDGARRPWQGDDLDEIGLDPRVGNFMRGNVRAKSA